MIKANVPNMHSEAAMIQDLMSDKAAMEVGGYSLATLQTCLQYASFLIFRFWGFLFKHVRYLLHALM